MRLGATRVAEIVTGTLPGSPTEIMTWNGSTTGAVINVWIHSLNLGDAEVSLYILPPGVTTCSDVYLVVPKDVPIPNQSTLDLELSIPIPINRGETLAATADVSGRALVLAVTEQWSATPGATTPFHSASAQIAPVRP